MAELFPVPPRKIPKRATGPQSSSSKRELVDGHCGIFTVRFGLATFVGLVLAGLAFLVYFVDQHAFVTRKRNNIWKILAIIPFIMVVSALANIFDNLLFRLTLLTTSTKFWEIHLYLSALSGVWSWIACIIALLVLVEQAFDIPTDQKSPLNVILGYILAYFLFDIPRRLWMRSFLHKQNKLNYFAKVKRLAFIQLVVADLEVACNDPNSALNSNVILSSSDDSQAAATRHDHSSQSVKSHKSKSSAISTATLAEPARGIAFPSLVQAMLANDALSSCNDELADKVVSTLTARGGGSPSRGEAVLRLRHFELVFETSVALKAFQLFFSDLDGTLTDEQLREELGHRVVSREKFLEAFDGFRRQQTNLKLELGAWDGLSDTIIAVSKVSQAALVFFLSLLFASAEVGSVVLPFTSVLLSISFAFGETLKNWLNSALFVTVIKPYDVGDQVRIEGAVGTLTVRDIDVVNTHFEDDEGMDCSIPNYVLNTRVIKNLSRSDNPVTRYLLQVGISTPLEALAQFEKAMLGYVQSLPGIWMSNATVSWERLTKMNHIEIIVKARMLCACVDSPFILANQKNLANEIQAQAKRLGIVYLEPPTPVKVTKQ